MNEKTIEQAQQQTTQWLEHGTTLARTGFQFGREESERQLRNGMAQAEFVQQAVVRQWEQALQLGKAVVDMQEGMLTGTMHLFTPPRA